ncbi:MAG: hypothetical protein ABF778_08895 [Liquorilactobacillus hordei]
MTWALRLRFSLGLNPAHPPLGLDPATPENEFTTSLIKVKL